MKRTILPLLLAATAVMALGADLDPRTRLIVKRSGIDAPMRHAPAREAADEQQPSPYIPMILMIDLDREEAVRAELEACDVTVWRSRDELLLTSIPRDRFSEVLAIEGILNGASSGDMSSCMDVARAECNIDAVHAGHPSLPAAYNGAGVVTGFCDIGFDAHHIAFGDRVASIYHLDAFEGTELSAVTPSEIAEWVTDTNRNFHATHVAGIMAGGYTDGAYYGVAPGATIVATTSCLSDVGILAGAEHILDYAREHGMPAVINMSLANYTGPHDGTDLFCRYLSRIASEAALCISAGNGGQIKAHASTDLTPEKPETRISVSTYRTWDGFAVDGITDLWCDTSTPFRMRLEVYDMDGRAIVASWPWIGGDSGIDTFSVDNDDPVWATYFDGYAMAEAQLSPLNNRYNITIAYDYKSPTPNTQGKPWARYFLSVAVEGTQGQHIDYYADGSTSYFGTVYGDPVKPNTDASINNMCTAPGVISVGMWNSRNTAPSLDSDDFTWNFTVGTVSEYSSYAAVPNIAPLPHICAPGCYIVSAMSGPFMQNDPEAAAEVSAMEPEGQYWWPRSGTSMASPYVAGVFALWLQADPNLRPADLLATAQNTARTDFADFADPRWGAGSIDALAGLRNITACTDLSVNPCTGTNAPVYDITGRPIDSSRPLAPGIYISEGRKILVR